MATPVKDGKLLAPFVYCVEVTAWRSNGFIFSPLLKALPLVTLGARVGRILTVFLFKYRTTVKR